MIVKYRLGRRGGENWSEPRTLAPTMRSLRARGQDHDGLKGWRFRGEDSWRPQMKRLSSAVRGAKVGEVFYILAKDGFVFAIRVVDVKPVLMDTQGTPNIDRIFTDVVNNFPGVESWGICNCRRISGSSSWSYHAWCQAWDLHASITTMDRIAVWLRQHAAEYDILHVLWRVADHFDHIHVDVEPERGGQTPPCA